MSRLEFHVKVFTDRTVYYKKSRIAPADVLEEWTGVLSETDYRTFESGITEKCRFMSLPENIKEPFPVKDSSTDEISVTFNSKKHTTGGYAARHQEKYRCVYQSYNQMLGSVKNIKYKIKRETRQP
jgi:uncharacterized protein with NRDE domain